jgi:hypothetical protein
MLNGRAIMRNGRALGRLAASACCCGATGPCVPAIPCEPCVNQTGPTCFVNVGQVRMWSFSGSPVATVNYATTNCCRCGVRANRTYSISTEESVHNFGPSIGIDCLQVRTLNGNGVPNAQNRITIDCTRVQTPSPPQNPLFCAPGSQQEQTQASIQTACRPSMGVLAGPSGLPWGQSLLPELISLGQPNFSNVVAQFANANPATFQVFGYMREDCDAQEWFLRTVDTSAPPTVYTTVSQGFVGLNRNPGSCHPVTCQPEGACCCGGSCYAQVTQSQCAGMGGTWRGPNTYCDNTLACTQPGACCINQQCQQLSQGDCIAQGGVWRGTRPCIDRECVGITTPNPGGPLTPSVAGVGSVGAGAFL